MNSLVESAAKLWSHTIFVHIYSSPNFVMETLISLIMVIIHCLLIAEINGIIKEINVPPLKIRIKKSLGDIKSQRSIYRGVVRNHPDLGVDVVFKENSFLKSDWNTTTKINKLLSTTLSEYIRRDLQKTNLPIESEGKSEEVSSRTSTDKIYDYLLTEPELHKKLNCEELKKFERTEILRLE
ncbi:hypothetical protein TcasGA2_TC015894 [Tribolium castaneum]|uniref:Uncharacterized protein n=1 Tax=Tribolium castaneum TaxID=7070 RepID=D6WU05_TRICA|nr:hypothetical protein TcasGA2_TC015894 [Tribolium castaneum]